MLVFSADCLNNGIISYDDTPRGRWTCYSSGNSSDWVVFDFGSSINVDSVKLYFYDDQGGVKVPVSYNVQYWNGSSWVDCSNQSKSPSTPQGNMVNTNTFTSVSTSKIKIIFVHQSGSYSGATEIEAFDGSTNLSTGCWKGTDSLTNSPTVNVNGNTATFNNILYTAGECTISETWTVTAGDSDISLKVDKTYSAAASLTDQKTISFAFKEKAFDVVQRTEDGGSFILLDKDRNTNRFLSNKATAKFSTGSYYNNDKYSFYTANMDFIDKLNSKILSINLSSNRNRATKIWRPIDRSGTRALKVEHKLNSDSFSFPSGTYLPLKIFQAEDFNAVSVDASQTDTATYTFSCLNSLDKYYDLGSIPDSSGLDEYKLAQYMQDFGRSSVVDKNVGVGDCDVSGIGTYETWWYSVNALGLQGAGNEKYLETLKNFVIFIKNQNYPLYNNGHIFARTYREMTSWEGDNFMDGQAQFVAGIAHIFNLSNDTAWLNDIEDMTRSILDWTLGRDTDGDGLIESFNDYHSYNRSADWNDCVSVAHESAYAKIGNREKPLSMLKTATDRYITDNLWCLDCLNWDLTPELSFAEPWMSAGCRPAAGYYNFILGIQPKYDKIIIDPCLDSSLYGVSSKYRLRGHDFTIELNSQTVRNITSDGSIPVESVWSNLPLNVKYKIKDENLTTGETSYYYADSGTIGRVSYTFNSGGQHRLTLEEDTNCTNLARNTSGTGYPLPSASYTYYEDNVLDAVDGDWTDGNYPRTRWTCYGSGNASDWYAVDFGNSKNISEVRVNFFDDGLGVSKPSSYDIQYWDGSVCWDGSVWVTCPSQVKYPLAPIEGENKITFTSVNTSRLRIVMTHHTGKYSGITEFRAYK